MENSSSGTLAEQIRKKIGLRIFICIVLYLVFFMTITVYDFSRGMAKAEIQVKNIAAELDEYIISQILIDNAQSIKIKLKEVALKNDVSIYWNKNAKPGGSDIKWSFPLGWGYESAIATLDGRSYGSLVFAGSFANDKGFLFEMLTRVSFLILFLIFLLLILYPLTLKIPKTLFVDPLLSLLSLLTMPETYKKNTSVVMKTLELKQIEEKIIYLLEKTKRDSKSAAIGQVASQVAHDIRSPLAALNVLMGEEHQMDRDYARLFHSAIDRINDIANNLLKDNEDQLLSHFKSDNHVLEEGFIFPSINAVLLEKQLELSSSLAITVNVSRDFCLSYGRFDRSILSRLLSNIINNSCDATEPPGVITVDLSLSAAWYIIMVKDNGCGMSDEVKKRVFEYGFSYGKEEGSGIGLAYSKASVESWGGEIDIHSDVGVGTEVAIKLPLLLPPNYLTLSVHVAKEDVIVIVSEDTAVHDACISCFNQIENSNTVTLRLAHLYSSADFEAWHQSQFDGERCQFVIDNDLTGGVNGLNLIDKFNINRESYLVASQYKSDSLLAACQSRYISLIPKPVVRYINVRLQ